MRGEAPGEGCGKARGGPQPTGLGASVLGRLCSHEGEVCHENHSGF